MYDIYIFQIYIRMYMVSLRCKYDDSYTMETF